MRTSTWWIIIFVLLLIILGLAWTLFMTPAPSPTTTNATSTAATTTDAGGSTSTSTSTTTAQTPIVTSPAAGGTVHKSFSVAGQAPGTWYFEAVFPIEVRNASGTVVATGHAQAQGEWMTTSLVPFTASITVGQYSGPATLVLKKDNPSGLPQNDGSFSIPIIVQ